MAESSVGNSPSPLAAEIEAALETGVVPEPLRIRLTTLALKEGERLAAESAQVMPLRIYLDGKGCDGFFYGVAFSETLPDDLSYEQGSLTLVVDRETFPFVAGSQIDWVDDERGRGFLVDNPHHKRFRGKFFKRKAWQDYFTDKKTGARPPGSNTPEATPDQSHS